MPPTEQRDATWQDRLLPRRLIVTFHGLGPPTLPIDPAEAPYWVAPDSLRQTIGLALVHDIQITFDDGYRSDHQLAWPMLQEAGLTGHFFVLAGRLDRPGSLARADIVAMARSGMRIGSHGYDHLDWTRCDDTTMRRELHDARAAIEDCLGMPVDTVSVPFGAFDRRVLRLVGEAGYRQVFTSSETLAPRSGWLMPRHSIRRDTRVATDLPRWRSPRAAAVSAARNLLRGTKYGF